MLKSEGMAEAAKSKLVIGLSWEPKLPLLSSGTKKGSDKPSRTLPESSSSSAAVYKSNTELIDGLFVPPNIPKKLNKLLRKQVKDTVGKNWFDMPAQTLTPELKKDLQLLKQIGNGNFSCVFKVLKRIDGCFYAVKNSTRLLHQYTESWQDINPVAAIGYVVVVDKLLTIQNKSYGQPTILVAKSVKGEEDIPDNAVAMMILDMPDVLSHVSVRARNSKVKFTII
ncbi:hypothetical protein LOK49_LG11G02148 [Camellia lanceoleosa]|uniref:Uncharacterized protein n=1 Tax=Camellia lanceoleosa TaxID=1840588 RepID=A0ACC0G1F8_9ERIC|nr:hypothetical protein LOK49_LG11G02148 [Camellia lanceoleosa]